MPVKSPSELSQWMFQLDDNILLRDTQQKKCEYMNNTDFDEETEENIQICPECKTMTIIPNEDSSYEYCETCGLITRASMEYVAGQRIDLPYGIIIK